MKVSSLQQSPAYLSAGSSSTSSIMAATMSASAPLMKPRPAAPLPPPLPLPRPRPAANPAPPFCRCAELIGALSLEDSTSTGMRLDSGSSPASWACCWCQFQPASQLSWQSSCHSQDGLLQFSLPRRQTGTAEQSSLRPETSSPLQWLLNTKQPGTTLSQHLMAGRLTGMAGMPATSRPCS